MEQILIEIQKLSKEVAAVNKRLEEYETSKQFDNWIPRKKLMDFLGYEATQMAALLNSGKLKVSEIGIRKFIKKDSFINLLEENIKK